MEELKGKENQLLIIVDKKTGEVSDVFDNEQKIAYKHQYDAGHYVTVEGGILLVWHESSPGHWCIINGRRVWCP